MALARRVQLSYVTPSGTEAESGSQRRSEKPECVGSTPTRPAEACPTTTPIAQWKSAAVRRPRPRVRPRWGYQIPVAQPAESARLLSGRSAVGLRPVIPRCRSSTGGARVLYPRGVRFESGRQLQPTQGARILIAPHAPSTARSLAWRKRRSGGPESGSSNLPALTNHAGMPGNGDQVCPTHRNMGVRIPLPAPSGPRSEWEQQLGLNPGDCRFDPDRGHQIHVSWERAQSGRAAGLSSQMPSGFKSRLSCHHAP